jgi:hypothetical protein
LLVCRRRFLEGGRLGLWLRLQFGVNGVERSEREDREDASGWKTARHIFVLHRWVAECSYLGSMGQRRKWPRRDQFFEARKREFDVSR